MYMDLLLKPLGSKESQVHVACRATVGFVILWFLRDKGAVSVVIPSYEGKRHAESPFLLAFNLLY